MAKGIIYVCSTVVDGLIKIGKTGSDNFEQRMYILESNGYKNVTGLKRRFAIEVEDYDEKETLIDNLFARSKVGNTELFSLNINEVIQLLSSFEGKQVYPVAESKSEVFEEATEATQIQRGILPDGTYTISVKNKKTTINAKGTMIVENGILTLKAGSIISPISQDKYASWMTARNSLKINNNILVEDYVCSSPSMAASLVCGHNKNGWESWKNSNNQFIDVYRNTINEEE